jgi:hypothetical protein
VIPNPDPLIYVQDIPDAKFNWLVSKYAGTKAPVNGSTESTAVSWTNSNTFLGYLLLIIKICRTLISFKTPASDYINIS